MKMLLLVAAVLAADPVSENEFEQLRRETKPDAAAAWRSIPWRTSVLDAQAEAARSGKPIFIWAMDGHPLGCT